MDRYRLPRLTHRTALVAALLCLAAGPVNAAVHGASGPASLFVQAEAAKTANHPKFLHLLERLRRQEGRLSPSQHWHLEYLEAWQAAFAGKPSKATPILEQIIGHSGDSALITRATALRINILTRGHRYEKAYRLANKLMAGLPKVTDATARAAVYRQIIQMLGSAGQYSQAVQYARQLLGELGPAGNRCAAYTYEINVLFLANKLTAATPELRKAIGRCLADKESVYANTLRLDRASLLIDEGHAGRAVALLHRVTPSIRRVKFEPHVASLHATLAQAYLSRGDDARAKEAALIALKVGAHGGFTWPLQAANQVLYRVEEKAGHDASALSHYKKYVAFKEAASKDTKARALAYQMVKQQVVAKKLKLEALTRQNRILHLRQALAQKQAETSRLYIALLLVAIILIGLWLYRVKHSQMRFRRMARHDGLTGTFNRQYFIDEAHRVLHRLRKARVDACLVLMDLDHFKGVNDSHGHIAGDEVLKRAVEISVGELRSSDLFGRVGGEEFGILMPGCSREHGVDIGNRIRHALANTPISLDTGASVTVSASLGLASSAVSGYTVTQLFADADAALYKAKHRGRNQLIVGNASDAGLVAGSTMTPDPS